MKIAGKDEMTTPSEEAKIFPAELLGKAERSAESDELYWRRNDALTAIDALEKGGKFILGLDFFRKEGSAMRVLGYPNFGEQLNGPGRVEGSCRLAREYIRSREAGPEHRGQGRFGRGDAPVALRLPDAQCHGRRAARQPGPDAGAAVGLGRGRHGPARKVAVPFAERAIESVSRGRRPARGGAADSARAPGGGPRR